MNYRMIRNVIGRIMCTEAAFMVPALLISAFNNEGGAVKGFLITIALLLAAGLPMALIRRAGGSFYAREGFVVVGLAWLVVSLFGGLPFFISGDIPNFVDCFFESVSGFTTTGSSILTDVEAMPRGHLYWRSFTHWLGGMGVLVFIMALSPLTRRGRGDEMHLLRAESPGVIKGKLVPHMHQSAALLYKIYIVLTIVQIILLLLGGIPLFDAVTITLGTAGTGGFAIKNDSMMSYSPYVQVVTTVFMIIFATNFNIFYFILIKEFKKCLKNEELRTYLAIILVSIAAITINISSMYGSVGEAVRHAAFQVATIISTTGYASTDFDLWPEFSKAILLLLMFIGAMAGSTGGGIKVIRILTMFKAGKRAIYKAIHPRGVKLVHLDGEVMEDGTVSSVQNYMMIYFIIFFASLLLVTVDGFSFETNFTAVATCFNNVGPGLAGVGPTMNFSQYSMFSKIVLSLDMLLGRLELFPMLILLSPFTWKK
ncbi:MAG: TrkH family potassium uptake protein [Oscillospiraceae bacterium]